MVSDIGNGAECTICGLTGNPLPNTAASISNAAASSSSSSRNNSPRTLLNESSASSVSSVNGGIATSAKLRPTASAAAARQHASGALLQRNSVNYTGSTLQEDLMRLINPDLMGQPTVGQHYQPMGQQQLQQHSSDDNFHHGPLIGSRPQKNTASSHSLGNISASVAALNGLSAAPASLLTDELLLMRKKSRSREAINLGSHGMPISGEGKFKAPAPPIDQTAASNNNGSAEVILTTARPATVIANANNNVNGNGGSESLNFLHIREDAGVRQSTRRAPTANTDYSALLFKHRSKDASAAGSSSTAGAHNIEHAGLLMPSLPTLLGPNGTDTKEVDWSRLVDDAIQQVNEGLKHSAAAAAANKSATATAIAGIGAVTANDTADESGCGGGADLNESGASAGLGATMTPSNSVPELQQQVVQLEDRIGKETRRRRSLEQAVRRLTEENRRLQDESQAAVQQLRRFTEWFFQTIDRQN